MVRWRAGFLSCLVLGTLSCHVPAPVRHAFVEIAATPSVVAPSSPDEDDPAVARAAAYLRVKRSGLTEVEIDAVAETIVGEARRHGLDPGLVMAVIHIESRGNSYALSPVGAMGMMQIMPATGAELAAELGIPYLGPQTLFDPHVNVRLGVAYLRQLEARYRNIQTALAAYNWGPGRIDRKIRRGTPLPIEYVDSVLDAYAVDPIRTARASRARTGT